MADAVIIGSGVIGTASAYYLSQAGWRVTLLDRGRFAGGCSHGNCGYVCPSHVLPHAGPGAIRATLGTLLQRNSPLKVRPGTVLRNLGWFRGFARRCNERDMLHAATGIQALLNSSRTLYDELLANEALDVEWDEAGLLFAFHSLKAFEHYRHVDELLRTKFAMPATRFEKDALLALEPSLKPEAVSGGYLYESDAQLRPDRLMTTWRNVLELRGVSIVENCELTSLGANEAITSKGTFKADAFVIATGAWTPKLGIKVPIIPGKGYSITMPRPKLCPKHPLIFEEHRVAVSPFASGYRIGSMMEFAGYDESMNPARLQLLKDGAAFYLNEPLAEPVQEQWWGWRPMVYDGKPIIDFNPKQGNVLIAAGHGMLGLSMATGTGRLVTELLTKQTPHVDPAHYSLSRFR